MKLITRDTDYAVRALCFIAECGKDRVSVRELVDKLKIPRPFLRKILQRLSKKWLVISHKGVGGGFSLAAPAHRIFLVDIIETFQGSFKLNECLFRKKVCPDVNICVLRQKMDAIERSVLAELKSITIKSLLNL